MSGLANPSLVPGSSCAEGVIVGQGEWGQGLQVWSPSSGAGVGEDVLMRRGPRPEPSVGAGSLRLGSGAAQGVHSGAPLLRGCGGPAPQAWAEDCGLGWDALGHLPCSRSGPLGYLVPSQLALPWVGWVCIWAPAERGGHWAGAEVAGHGCPA